jgi:hypothetical protein
MKWNGKNFLKLIGLVFGQFFSIMLILGALNLAGLNLSSITASFLIIFISAGYWGHAIIFMEKRWSN